VAEDKKKRGLGRGLKSLFGDPLVLEDTQEDVKISSSNKLVPISDLSRNKFQPRMIFDKEKISELSSSIAENGLIQPIVVRPTNSENTKFEIIAGERRWLAAQQAGLNEVPVVILDLNDSQSLEVAIVENIQREDLNSIEEAKAYEKLVNEFNYDHEKLSKFVGKSRSHISNTLRLLSLPKEVTKMVEDGKLTAGQVRPLIGRANSIELANQIYKEKLSARSIENLVRRDKDLKYKKDDARAKIDSNILSAQKQIEESIGLKVNILNKKNNTGKIIIEYKNLDQFDLVSSLLKTKN
tara:strand:+ start:224 stop:1111 length:888 start_codon:yes stop_codon:yes gene_type:complete